MSSFKPQQHSINIQLQDDNYIIISSEEDFIQNPEKKPKKPKKPKRKQETKNPNEQLHVTVVCTATHKVLTFTELTKINYTQFKDYKSHKSLFNSQQYLIFVTTEDYDIYHEILLEEKLKSRRSLLNYRNQSIILFLLNQIIKDNKFLYLTKQNQVLVNQLVTQLEKIKTTEEFIPFMEKLKRLLKSDLPLNFIEKPKLDTLLQKLIYLFQHYKTFRDDKRTKVFLKQFKKTRSKEDKGTSEDIDEVNQEKIEDYDNDERNDSEDADEGADESVNQENKEIEEETSNQ